MKKHLLLIATLFTLTAKAQTNVYHPFPDSAAVWNINMIVSCVFHGWEFDYYSIQISGDTVLSSQVYQKLSIPFIQHNGTDFCSEELGYQGAVRQDTSIKKVFYVPPTDTIEQLLYDFNMQVGDTVRGFLEPYLYDIVQSIDSVLVGSTYRKKWNFNQGYNISLIEGVGSTYGLIQTSPGTAVDFPDYSITCFRQNSITLYPDTTTNCELINRAKEISSNFFITSISPNPIRTSALLKVSLEFETANLNIYNSLGLLVREERIFNKNILVINRNGLRNGIYFLQLINDKGQIATEKFAVE